MELLGLPPHGGSGLKFCGEQGSGKTTLSPSTRREWIEIDVCEIMYGITRSPSTRREWIEILRRAGERKDNLVSLHTEGVD